MSRTLVFLVAAGTLLPGQLVARAEEPRNNGVNITDCSYWQRKKAEVADAARDNRAKAARTKASSSFSSTYIKAAQLEEAALPKYEAKYRECMAKYGNGANGGAGGGSAKSAAELQKMLDQLGQQAGQQAAAAITAILNATNGLQNVGYTGSGNNPAYGLGGFDSSEDQYGDPSDTWSDNGDGDGYWADPPWKQETNEHFDVQWICYREALAERRQCAHRCEIECNKYEHVCDTYGGVTAAKTAVTSRATATTPVALTIPASTTTRPATPGWPTAATGAQKNRAGRLLPGPVWLCLRSG